MTSDLKRNSKLRAVSATAGGLCLALCLAAGPAQAVLVTTYNTGAAGPGPTPATLPTSAIDPNFYLVINPSSVSSIGQTFVQPTPTGWVTSPNSEWISPVPNGVVSFVDYYQTRFDLTGFIKSTALLAGQWASFLPSPNTNVYLNGSSLNALSPGGTFNSTPTAWAAFAGFGTAFTNALNPGMNYLTFAVNGSPAIAGTTWLRAEYRIDAVPVPEPSTYALFGLGLAAVGLARVRRLAVAADQPT
jgi:PEP-CTERM motif